MDDKEIKSIIEAILFIWSEPICIKELSRVLDISVKETHSIIEKMIQEFDNMSRGIQIIKVNEYYQFSTRPEHHSYIQKLVEPQKNKGLTQAALETLAIIAYNQPITKIQIEEIRGVKCDKAISTLQDRELIQVKGRLEQIGRPMIYGTTPTFLKTFGLESIDELPDIEEFNIHI